MNLSVKLFFTYNSVCSKLWNSVFRLVRFLASLRDLRDIDFSRGI